MARESHRERLWPHLLRMEVYCQRLGTRPHAAAVRVARESGHVLPGKGSTASNTRILKKYHKEYRTELRRQLAGEGHPIKAADSFQQEIFQALRSLSENVPALVQNVGNIGQGWRETWERMQAEATVFRAIIWGQKSHFAENADANSDDETVSNS